MKRTFRLSITWLHTWAGLLLGWLCFAIFVTGTATYFRHEITRWMKPELRAGTSPATAARTAITKLETIAPKSETWFINLPDGRDPSTVIYWRDGGPRRFANKTIDPISGEKISARESFGGEFFYRFHFQLLLPHPWGRYLAGVAAMFMFVALISGIIAHRRFFKEMFKLRRGAGSFRAWLDFHNLTGTIALPFIS